MNSNPNMVFLNRSFDKKRLKALLLWFRLNLSESASLKAVETLQELGFRSATQGAISLGLDDLKTPSSKGGRVFQAQLEVALAHHEHHRGNRTPVELFQHLVDTWHRTSQDLTAEVVQLFHSTERVNPVYMMAFSGARGNLSQVRQLVGMRGLMADPRGQIVGFPILSNFREGLTITEYFVSCYGARKGVVDTAIRTADAGYLTRRLADVSHHVVVRTTNCGTHRNIRLRDIKEGEKTILSLANRLVGRVLAENIVTNPGASAPMFDGLHSKHPPEASSSPPLPLTNGERSGGSSETCMLKGLKTPPIEYSSKSGPSSLMNPGVALHGKNRRDNQLRWLTSEGWHSRNEEIAPNLAAQLALHYLEVAVRSPLTCSLRWGVCQLCYGWGLAEGRRVTLGEAVGIIAAQSIGEPGTQLTLRTFHTGGVFSGDLLNEIRAPYGGNVLFPKPLQGLLIRTPHGQIAFLTKVSGKMAISYKATATPAAEEVGSSSLPELEPLPLKQSGQQSLGIEKADVKRTGPGVTDPMALTAPQEPLAVQGDALAISLDSTVEENQEFLIKPSTVVFVRQNEQVYQNQLLAEFSSSSFQSANDQIEVTQQVLSAASGQVWFEEMQCGTRKGPGSGSLGTTFSSQKLGGIWVLAGKSPSNGDCRSFPLGFSHYSRPCPLGSTQTKQRGSENGLFVVGNWDTPYASSNLRFSLFSNVGVQSPNPLKTTPECAQSRDQRSLFFEARTKLTNRIFLGTGYGEDSPKLDLLNLLGHSCILPFTLNNNRQVRDAKIESSPYESYNRLFKGILQLTTFLQLGDSLTFQGQLSNLNCFLTNCQLSSIPATALQNDHTFFKYHYLLGYSKYIAPTPTSIPSANQQGGRAELLNGPVQVSSSNFPVRNRSGCFALASYNLDCLLRKHLTTYRLSLFHRRSSFIAFPQNGYSHQDLPPNLFLKGPTSLRQGVGCNWLPPRGAEGSILQGGQLVGLPHRGTRSVALPIPRGAHLLVGPDLCYANNQVAKKGFMGWWLPVDSKTFPGILLEDPHFLNGEGRGGQLLWLITSSLRGEGGRLPTDGNRMVTPLELSWNQLAQSLKREPHRPLRANVQGSIVSTTRGPYKIAKGQRSKKRPSYISHALTFEGRLFLDAVRTHGSKWCSMRLCTDGVKQPFQELLPDVGKLSLGAVKCNSPSLGTRVSNAALCKTNIFLLGQHRCTPLFAIHRPSNSQGPSYLAKLMQATNLNWLNASAISRQVLSPLQEACTFEGFRHFICGIWATNGEAFLHTQQQESSQVTNSEDRLGVGKVDVPFKPVVATIDKAENKGVSERIKGLLRINPFWQAFSLTNCPNQAPSPAHLRCGLRSKKAKSSSFFSTSKDTNKPQTNQDGQKLFKRAFEDMLTRWLEGVPMSGVTSGRGIGEKKGASLGYKGRAVTPVACHEFVYNFPNNGRRKGQTLKTPLVKTAPRPVWLSIFLNKSKSLCNETGQVERTLPAVQSMPYASLFSWQIEISSRGFSSTKRRMERNEASVDQHMVHTANLPIAPFPYLIHSRFDYFQQVGAQISRFYPKTTLPSSAVHQLRALGMKESEGEQGSRDRLARLYMLEQFSCRDFRNSFRRGGTPVQGNWLPLIRQNLWEEGCSDLYHCSPPIVKGSRKNYFGFETKIASTLVRSRQFLGPSPRHSEPNAFLSFKALSAQAPNVDLCKADGFAVRSIPNKGDALVKDVFHSLQALLCQSSVIGAQIAIERGFSLFISSPGNAAGPAKSNLGASTRTNSGVRHSLIPPKGKGPRSLRYELESLASRGCFARSRSLTPALGNGNLDRAKYPLIECQAPPSSSAPPKQVYQRNSAAIQAQWQANPLRVFDLHLSILLPLRTVVNPNSRYASAVLQLPKNSLMAFVSTPYITRVHKYRSRFKQTRLNKMYRMFWTTIKQAERDVCSVCTANNANNHLFSASVFARSASLEGSASPIPLPRLDASRELVNRLLTLARPSGSSVNLSTVYMFDLIGWRWNQRLCQSCLPVAPYNDSLAPSLPLFSNLYRYKVAECLQSKQSSRHLSKSIHNPHLQGHPLYGTNLTPLFRTSKGMRQMLQRATEPLPLAGSSATPYFTAVSTSRRKSSDLVPVPPSGEAFGGATIKRKKGRQMACLCLGGTTIGRLDDSPFPAPRLLTCLTINSIWGNPIGSKRVKQLLKQTTDVTPAKPRGYFNVQGSIVLRAPYAWLLLERTFARKGVVSRNRGSTGGISRPNPINQLGVKLPTVNNSIPSRIRRYTNCFSLVRQIVEYPLHLFNKPCLANPSAWGGTLCTGGRVQYNPFFDNSPMLVGNEKPAAAPPDVCCSLRFFLYNRRLLQPRKKEKNNSKPPRAKHPVRFAKPTKAFNTFQPPYVSRKGLLRPYAVDTKGQLFEDHRKRGSIFEKHRSRFQIVKNSLPVQNRIAIGFKKYFTHFSDPICLSWYNHGPDLTLQSDVSTIDKLMPQLPPIEQPFERLLKVVSRLETRLFLKGATFDLERVLKNVNQPLKLDASAGRFPDEDRVNVFELYEKNRQTGMPNFGGMVRNLSKPALIESDQITFLSGNVLQQSATVWQSTPATKPLIVGLSPSSRDLRGCSTNAQHANTCHLFPGQLVNYGESIFLEGVATTESGQVVYIDSQRATLRKAQTVLIYSQAILAVLSGEWVQKGAPLMALSYQKLVTGDIVQGLPKIEQFFEAPMLKDGTFWSDSLQAKLNQSFQHHREQLPLAEAVRKGFYEIQRILVEGVQRVYISQGVLIADKHLEVIVRQMTCKARILYSGDTGFLRNELVTVDKIESVNQVTYGQKALYHPQVRGITDASLESESFLSAASFQETTRVLSRDAIVGKTDLMRGLKERVIVGEIIQAGTGLVNNKIYLWKSF